jgi:uncharacterized protein
MTVLQALAVLAAGVFAGCINTVVGSGTLVTFPVLLAVGYPPVVATVSNSLGLVPGSATGAIGYRRELVGQRARLLRLGACSVLGGITGSVLLLMLPPDAFESIVPVLIILALVLVVTQPMLARRLAARRSERPQHGGIPLMLATYGTGTYGGYFAAAQGVLLLGFMGILMDEELQRLNAVKNVLTALVNTVAGVMFIFVAHVAWPAVIMIAIGATIGGMIGAKIGRKLPPVVLRCVIIVVGVAAIIQLLTK